MASPVKFNNKNLDYGIQTTGGALFGTVAETLGYAKNSLGVSAGIGAGFFFVTEAAANLSKSIFKGKGIVREAMHYGLGGLTASVLFLGASYALPVLFISPLEALALTITSFALKQLVKHLSEPDRHKPKRKKETIIQTTGTTTTTASTTATTNDLNK